MQYLRQSTAATVTIGPILDSAGAEYTGAVIGDISIRKHDGTSSAALASAATLTHDANGMYKLVFTTGNTDTLGRLDLHCNKSTYQMPPKSYDVVPAMIYDSLILGTDRLDANVTHVADTAQTARDIGASVLLSSGTGTGQVKLSSGYVAPNWGDVGNPTTTNNLSGTTVKTATDIATLMTGGRLIPAGHIGDTDFDSAVYFDFTTVDQKGVPITLAGTPSIAAYENASTTETTANITLSVDHDGKTGTHRVTISSGSSWSVGSTITFRLVGGTVNGVSVTGHYLASCSYLAATARMVVITQSTTDVTNPVTLVDGAITAAKIATDAIDADAIKADAITEIQSGLATSSALATVAGYVDTEVAAILAAVDTEVASIIAAIAALNNITAASVWAVGTRTLTAPTNLSIPSAADIADAVWDEARSGHVTPATFGGSFASIYAGTVTGTSSTTSIVDSGLTQSAADHWKGRIVVFTSGALAKQATDITAFTPASDTLTVTALTGAPQVGDTFEIY